MLIKEMVHVLELPEGVSIDSSSSDIKVTGPRGDLTRKFKHASMKFEQGENQLKIIGNKLRKKEKALIGTWKAHLSNMIKGWRVFFGLELIFTQILRINFKLIQFLGVSMKKYVRLINLLIWKSFQN